MGAFDEDPEDQNALLAWLGGLLPSQPKAEPSRIPWAPGQQPTRGADVPLADTWLDKGLDVVMGALGVPVRESKSAAAGELLSMLPLAGSVKAVTGAPAAARGLYSRVDDIVKQLTAKGAHPNKVASLLKSGAPAEEVAYRKIPEFLQQQGNTPVTPAAMQAHLTAHPAPTPKVKTLGTKGASGHYSVEQDGGSLYIVHPSGSTEWSQRLELMSPEDIERVTKEWHGAPANAKVETPTKFQQYQVPGGENYRETLLTLPPRGKDAHGFPRETPTPGWGDIGTQPTDRSDLFRSSHFEEPNILVHTRSNERTLPLEGMRPMDEIERLIQQAVGAQSPQSIASGAPDVAVRKGLITEQEAQLYGSRKGFHGFTAPTGPRGRFIEEVQSDWHQQGKKKGYGKTNFGTPAEQEAAHVRYEAARDAVNSATPGSPEWSGVVAEHRAAEAHMRDTVPGWGKASEGVPDAPYKETWPDLGLKQQILEAAEDPNLSWIGHTSGQTQADRYDLSKKISRVDFEPDSRGDYSLGVLTARDHDGNQVIREGGLEPKDLDEYIGKDAADNLRREIASREWDYSQWTVAQDEATGKWHGIDPNGEVIEDLGGKSDKERAVTALQGYLDNMRENDATASISGLDLQVGGEGMKHFYDQLLPKRLEKILKPFGGKVERGSLGKSKAEIDAEMDALHLNPPAGDDYGLTVNRLQEQRNAAPDDAAMWFARLTPEMKARILKEGLPLSVLLGLLTQTPKTQTPQEQPQ